MILAVIANDILASFPNIWISIAWAFKLILFVILQVVIHIDILILAILDNLWLLKDGILITDILLVRSSAARLAWEKVFGISFILLH